MITTSETARKKATKYYLRIQQEEYGNNILYYFN